MRRTFVEHHIRQVVSLDGLWQLTPDNGSGRSYPTYVPGVWERIPDLTSFIGTADYEREVAIREPGHYLLRFGGVSHTADVYFDGEPVARHYNAFTGFDVLLPDVEAGTHQLRVTADNRSGEDSALHIPNDYYNYGGISRSVELQRLGAAYVERLAFHAEKVGEKAYIAHVNAVVRAVEAVTDVRLQLAIDGLDARVSVPVPPIEPGEMREINTEFPVENVREWDVLNAQLYDPSAMVTVADIPVDDLMDRIGFRTVEVDGDVIRVNGKSVFIRGVNRHEDHGVFGCALPESAMMDDLQRILSLGCNSVRTCHYPNDPKFLDLCDELGILVWEENHARAIPIEIMRTETFRRQEADCNREMIEQHVNHPCIYIWGVLNECESETEEGRAIYADQLNQLRKLDPTRPVSFASCRFFTDICMDLPDVCCFNIYPRWYVNESVESYLDRLVTWMDTVGASGKPIMITEVGAGAIMGYHDPFGHAKWSEERQCDILTEQLTAIMRHPRVSGVYVWQFADVRVAEEWWHGRPKTMNNKGLVDQFRTPKMGFAAVKRMFGGR